jgi:Fe-S cluster assembly protein SufD
MINQLLGEFKQIKSGLNGKLGLPFNQARIAAIDNFGKLGFPTTRHEEWKYSNVKKIVGEDYNFHPKSTITKADLAPLNLPDAEGNLLYFVNGVFHPELSNIVEAGKVEVMTIQEARGAIPDFLNKYYGEITNNDTEAFTAMNTALANDGVVIHVPANTTLEQPIILRMISDVRVENVGCIIRNLIVVDKNAEVKIAEAYRTLGGKKAFVNTVSEIYVDQDARVDYYKVQSESNESSHIGTTQVYQKDKSYFYSATVTLDGGFVRNNLNLILDGEYINSHMYGLYIPNGTQHIDNHTVVDHRKPNSESNELYKGILMDKSNGVFNGKIFVQQEAQKTNAYQHCKNVITTDSATMNTKPQLEIWADDVKCSHGTTTGQLNDEAIFYMQSRGIPKSEAIKLQLLAFANDVITEIKIDSIRDYLEIEIEKKLSQI